MNLSNFPNLSQLKSSLKNKDIIIGCFFLLILGLKFTYDTPSGLFTNVEQKLTTTLCSSDSQHSGCSLLEPTFSFLELTILLVCLFSGSLPLYSRFFLQNK